MCTEGNIRRTVTPNNEGGSQAARIANKRIGEKYG